MLSLLNALQTPSHQDEINGYVLSTERKNSDIINLAPPKPIQENVFTAASVSIQNKENSQTKLVDEKVKNEEEKALEMMRKLAEEVFIPDNDSDVTVSDFKYLTEYFDFDFDFVSSLLKGR